MCIVIVYWFGSICVLELSVIIVVVLLYCDVFYDVNCFVFECFKKEVFIWKCEYYEDGEEVWCEEELLIEEWV